MNKADARQELQVRLAREHNLTTAGKRHTKLVELVLERGLKARPVSVAPTIVRKRLRAGARRLERGYAIRLSSSRRPAFGGG